MAHHHPYLRCRRVLLGNAARQPGAFGAITPGARKAAGGEQVKICAWCGNPMEENGSDSHGICKPCVKEHYPEIYEKFLELQGAPPATC